MLLVKIYADPGHFPGPPDTGSVWDAIGRAIRTQELPLRSGTDGGWGRLLLIPATYGPSRPNEVVVELGTVPAVDKRKLQSLVMALGWAVQDCFGQNRPVTIFPANLDEEITVLPRDRTGPLEGDEAQLAGAGSDRPVRADFLKKGPVAPHKIGSGMVDQPGRKFQGKLVYDGSTERA